MESLRWKEDIGCITCWELWELDGVSKVCTHFIEGDPWL